VPAHPIAGKELAGIEHADALLYQDRQVILTPLPETPTQRVLQAHQLWQALGSRVLELRPEAHDASFAAVSHLPHLTAFALVNAVARQPNGAHHLSMAGPGFRDFSRIAASDPSVWRDILLANRDEVLHQSTLMREALHEFETAIQTGDADRLHTLIAEASQTRSRWRLGGAGQAPQARVRFGEQHGFSAIRVASLYQDVDATVWLGSNADGLFRWQPGSDTFLQYRHQTGDRFSVADNQLSSLFRDRAGTFWVGSWYNGVSRVDLGSGGFSRMARAPGDVGALADKKVRAVADAGNGKLWLATKGGLKMLTKGMAIDWGPWGSTPTASARATSRPNSTRSSTRTRRSAAGSPTARPAAAGVKSTSWPARRSFWPAMPRPL